MSYCFVRRPPGWLGKKAGEKDKGLHAEMLSGRREIYAGKLARMSSASFHRGIRETRSELLDWQTERQKERET